MDKERRYFAKDLNQLRCDECDAWIGFYDMSGEVFDAIFLCNKCKTQIERDQVEEWYITQSEILSRKLAEELCGEETGHNWVDITSSTFVMGSYVYSCTRCHATKMKPMNLSMIVLNDKPFESDDIVN